MRHLHRFKWSGVGILRLPEIIGTYDPDWMVDVKMQRNRDGTYTILYVVRLRGLSDEVEKTVRAVASQDGYNVKIVISQDLGQAGVAQAQYYAKILAGYKFEVVRETGIRQ